MFGGIALDDFEVSEGVDVPLNAEIVGIEQSNPSADHANRTEAWMAFLSLWRSHGPIARTAFQLGTGCFTRSRNNGSLAGEVVGILLWAPAQCSTHFPLRLSRYNARASSTILVLGTPVMRRCVVRNVTHSVASLKFCGYVRGPRGRPRGLVGGLILLITGARGYNTPAIQCKKIQHLCCI